MVDYDKLMEIGSKFADWSYDQGSRAISKTYSLTGKALKAVYKDPKDAVEKTVKTTLAIAAILGALKLTSYVYSSFSGSDIKQKRIYLSKSEAEKAKEKYCERKIKDEKGVERIVEEEYCEGFSPTGYNECVYVDLENQERPVYFLFLAKTDKPYKIIYDSPCGDVQGTQISKRINSKILEPAGEIISETLEGALDATGGIIEDVHGSIKKGVKKTAKHVSKDWKETENYLREKGLTREKIADSTGITYVKEAFNKENKAGTEDKPFTITIGNLPEQSEK